jgi:hypothetical protein
MKYRVRLALFVGLVSLGVIATVRTFCSSLHKSPYHPAEQPVSAAQAYENLLMGFEPNHGQFDSSVTYGSERPSYSIFLKSTGARIKMRSPGETHTSTVQMTFQGANERSIMRGIEAAPGVTNYYYGSQESWITNIPNYGRVIAEDVYPGIDAVYYGNQQRLEYDLIVKPRASAQSIDIAFDNATRLDVEKSGDLIVSMADRDVRLSQPVLYQNKHGERVPVDGRYVVTREGHVRFSVGQYDHTQPLIIDPQVGFSAYGDGAFAYGSAIDSTGNVYICGAAEKSQGATIAFVDKFNPAGTALVYHNVFGSSLMQSNDVAFAMAVDSSGNAYVTGHTDGGSPFMRFPTVNPIQATGFNDAFITKFDASGAMVYSTLLGGRGSGDTGTAIAVDHLGNIYVAGMTQSTDFPTFKPFQASLNGSSSNPDAFLTVLNPQGSAFIYSTYIGGTDADYATGIAVDASGNAYVSGTTNSTDFPASGKLSPYHGNGDGFVLKMNASGSALLYSAYLGGSGNDAANGIALDSSGNAYVAGTTSSTNFPTAGAFQSMLSGTSDAFLAKINPTGSALVYSTYLGGSNAETGAAVTVNGTNAYVVGQTFSSDFPQVHSRQGFTADSDAFVSRFSTDGTSLTYSTLLGGSMGCCHNGPTYAAARSVAGDGATNVAVAGDTSSSNFPTTVTPVGGCCGGTSHFNSEATFVAKLADDQASTTWTRVEQNNAAIQYAGDWFSNSSTLDSGGSAALTILGSATFSFSGTGARWVGYSDPWSGIANVYVDGVFKATVDTYSNTGKYQVIQYTITGLAPGNHTLKIQGTGQHSASGLSSWAWVDAFDYTTTGATGPSPDFSLTVTPTTSTAAQGGSTTYTVTVTGSNGFPGAVSLSASGSGAGASASFNPAGIDGSGSSILTISTTGSAQTGTFALTITGSSGALTHSATATLNVNPVGTGGTGPWTRVEESTAPVQFNGDWPLNSSSNNSGGTARLTLVNSVTFTFSGTGARWIGFSDPWSGIANVYVDGTLKASVDTYSATTRYQTIQYTITGLPSGQHILKIQATGQHDSQSHSSWVWVDAFDYTS